MCILTFEYVLLKLAFQVVASSTVAPGISLIATAADLVLSTVVFSRFYDSKPAIDNINETWQQGNTALQVDHSY